MVLGESMNVGIFSIMYHLVHALIHLKLPITSFSFSFFISFHGRGWTIGDSACTILKNVKNNPSHMVAFDGGVCPLM